MADEAQIYRCANWIKQLTTNERQLLALLLQKDDPGTAGVIAKLPDTPPDKEDGIAIPPDYWETAE